MGFLGLLYRGGQVLIGDAIKEGFAGISLLVIASDASQRTTQEFNERALRHHVEIVSGPDKKTLGAALGRSEISYLAIPSKKAAESLLAKLKED